MYRAVLDTCVLVPGLQRHFLLQLATEEAFAPLWSSGTVGELDQVLARIDAKRQRVDSESCRARLLTEMRLAFPGAEIRAPRDSAYDYDIDDPGDGHVVHAAILGKADAIVTDDRRSGLAASCARRLLRSCLLLTSRPTPSQRIRRRACERSIRWRGE